MNKSLWASYFGSFSALAVGACCVLPMGLMILGLGGSWMAVFGKIAAASLPVLGLSTLLVAVAWFVAYRRRGIAHLRWWLAGSTGLTAIAWGVVLNEARINDYLITLM